MLWNLVYRGCGLGDVVAAGVWKETSFCRSIILYSFLRVLSAMKSVSSIPYSKKILGKRTEILRNKMHASCCYPCSLLKKQCSLHIPLLAWWHLLIISKLAALWGNANREQDTFILAFLIFFLFLDYSAVLYCIKGLKKWGLKSLPDQEPRPPNAYNTLAKKKICLLFWFLIGC